MRRVLPTLLVVVLGFVLSACGGEDEDKTGPDANAVIVAAGEQAEAAAVEAVVAMTSYDYRTLDEDFSWVDELGTEKFQENYQGASKQIRQVITKLKSSATGKVIESAPKVESPTRVKVLLFVDQELTAEGEEGVRLDQPRVSMIMLKEGDRWLVDEVHIDELVAQ